MKAIGFPPVARPDARVLVLGSMPGVASLEAGQYYAHPRNRFWPLMGTLLGIDTTVQYAQRCAALVRAGVALWDVYARCDRPGSLDADIRRGSEVVNDFPAFFRTHPRVRGVFCNGATAHDAFRRRVATELPVHRLPSTSPANAAYKMPKLKRCWSAVQEYV